MSAELVRYTVSDKIAEIMLDRPPVNALSMPLIDALLAALQKAKDDPSVHQSSSAACTRCSVPGSISTSSGASPGSKPRNSSSGCISR